jgi:hypothetical protein
LIADRRVTKAGRNRIVVDRSSIDAFLSAKLNDTCTLDQAAKILGLKRSRLGRVVRQLLPSAWLASDRQWHIKCDEVEALTSITEGLATIEQIGDDEITLDAAMRYQRLSDSTLIALVDAGQKGTALKPVGRCDGRQVCRAGSSGAPASRPFKSLMSYRQSESDCLCRNSLSICASSRRSSTPSVALGRLERIQAQSPDTGAQS